MDSWVLVDRFSKLLVVVVTAVTVATFVWIGFRTTSLVEASVLTQARSYADLIVAARSWNSGYGGVYVKKGIGAETNPYLRELGVEPDDALSDGTPVTLRNPAAMTREIGDMLPFSENGSDFKITSLRPVNPSNAPDEWEQAALEAFERGEKERWVVADRGDDDRVYRYIRPLAVEQGCLTCHASGGYKLGDVRGGISIVLPYNDVLNELRQSRIQLAAVATFVLLGLWGIVLGLSRWLKRRLRGAEERLRELATTDELTGLWNRRFTLETLVRELERSRRSGTRAGVILVDIDHFKAVNDDFGHAAGDDALRLVAQALKDTVRPYDVVGRVGGEEMLIFAPDVDSESLLALAERLRAAVEAIDTSAVSGGRPLTISAGTALAAAESAVDVDALLARADAAMYAAKDAGRNRVVEG